MAVRDPHDVLGVPRDADQVTIRAAWRRLAREHHPDVRGADPAAARAATRRMAEINSAYEALRHEAGRPAGTPARARSTSPAAAPDVASQRPPTGPPRARPTRPVTRRVDTADTFQARNRPSASRGGRRVHPPGMPPPRASGSDPEPLRASDPTGPLRRDRLRHFVAPDPPSLAAALDVEMAFGKFRGHTLGEIAAFEPSYVDWIASTITRDADLVGAARVVRDDLDGRGVVRRRRETDRQRRDRLRQARDWSRIFGPDD